ncbi:hypothetical protein HMPREF0813_01012 [Streptococcus anginosus F0211]|uniref:Uncharacterized protein n=1 Tax=Streptococcus anginosus F0211 TaxID=706437 RepID=E6J187_STRAP|nr:hypothetical protein HMPREF0813_01012 [Streptococcus anginosus F0211]
MHFSIGKRVWMTKVNLRQKYSSNLKKRKDLKLSFKPFLF